MLKSKELRRKAWESLKGKFGAALLVTIIVGLLYGIGSSLVVIASEMMGVVAMVPVEEMGETEMLGALTISGMSLFIYFIGLLFIIFVGAPALIGNCGYFIKNTDGKPSIAEVFSGFKTRYGRNVGTILLIDIKTVLWTFLFIVPGIIKAFEYAIIPYILADDAEISSKDAFKKAKAMMNGNKWRLFKLNFSFIGWFLLAVIVSAIVGFISIIVLSIVAVVKSILITPTVVAIALIPLFIVAFVTSLLLVPYIDAANAEFYVELKNKQN